MADSSPYTKPHFPLSNLNSRIQPKPTNQGKSCSGFIFKSLFLALFVIVLPLFPSQAPEFVSQTILNKFWELFHLLFIGIAVAYGLFGRRNSELETTHLDTHHSSSDSTSPSYVSKMFTSSTIFGDVCENENNTFGFDEKRMMTTTHCWNPQYFDGEHGVVFSNGGTVGVFDEQYKPQFPISDGGFGYSVRCDYGNRTNVVQSWNSEYYHSDPVVVVAQPNFTNGECGEVVDYKPLGLPVRSLRSVARDVDCPKHTNESDSSSCSKGSSRSSGKSRDREFGDQLQWCGSASNLEKIINVSAGGGGPASPIPWHARSRRMEREKRLGGNVSRPSHFRPLSVDETKFEAIGSRSSPSTTCFSSHTGMYSSLDSVKSDNVNFQEDEMRQEEASFVAALEKNGFHEEDMGQKMTSSHVPVSEDMNFQEEDMGPRKPSFVSAFENTNFQEEIDLGKKILQGSSSRTRKMTSNKGKYAAVSYPSHFRPMSVDEAQFESLSSKLFQSMGSFPSHTRMFSSMDSVSSEMDFQEEDMGQEKVSHLHTSSEYMNFHEEDLGHKKTSPLHASENVNFQEDMGQKKTSYVSTSENMNFHEVDSSSGNGMMDSKGKYAADSHPSQFRPISIDEAQIESCSSRSVQSMGSFSSQSSLCSSIDSVSSEKMNSLKEDSGEKKSSHGSSSSSPSPLARKNEEASLQAFQARGYNIASLLQDDMKHSLNDDLKGLNDIVGENAPGSKDPGMHALHTDSEKPASLTKARSRGKSVRTRRASGLTSGTMITGETSSKQTEEKVEKKASNVEPMLRKDKMRSGEPKVVGKKTQDSYYPKPEIKFSNHHKKNKLEAFKNMSKQDSDIELENAEVSSDKDVVHGHVNDSDLDSEVDKKASEFIAKFKAQIRLQKMGSIESLKELKSIGNKIR
ncbi:hypothetical protein RJT34_18220 [Clitoria ternatea]|uniref:Uncharacterized protein n=1 Tax=Clitoria ternatea TaxID=43366 RepID=A0AAN9JDJ2_CLITE